MTGIARKVLLFLMMISEIFVYNCSPREGKASHFENDKLLYIFAESDYETIQGRQSA